MVLLNEVLLDIREVERYSKRRKPPANAIKLDYPWQDLTFVPLSFNFSNISILNYFKCFQRLLWLTSVHFDKCLERDPYTMDGRVVYCQSDAFMSGLSSFAMLHKTIRAALSFIERRDAADGWTKIRTAFVPLNAVVQTHHHRWLSALSDILLILNVSGRFDIA